MFVNLITAHYTILPLHSRYPKIMPWDRMVNTVILNKFDPFYTKLIVPSFQNILDHPQTHQTFEEICYRQCEKLRQTKKPIFLFYSGGIDSTLILLIIMREWKKEDLERVNVVLGSNSILENIKLWPEIYNTFKNRLFNSHDSTLSDTILNVPDSIVVTGEIGDQIFGSDVMYDLSDRFGWEYMFKPWKQVIPILYKHMFIIKRPLRSYMTEKDLNDMLSDMEYTHSYSPIPIKSTYDYLWFFNYTNKTQHVFTRFLTSYPELNVLYKEKRMCAFYIDLDFLRWSLDAHHTGVKIKTTLESYKFAAKELIYKLSNDKDYFENKIKWGSLGNLFYKEPFYNEKIGIDDTYDFLNYDEVCKYVRTF